MRFRNRIEACGGRHDLALYPAIAIIDLRKVDRICGGTYKFRLAFAFWSWRVSIGLGKRLKPDAGKEKAV